ncbi:MAG: alpha-2,8-polysialyltransferase family protein [Sulfurimonas sp.]|nr:alpha-2,8-polysialyltransferase family protein [Sulfurimonas sp.]
MKNNLKNLFILKSPLQIINAIEAVEYFQLKNNVFVFIYSDITSNEKQMKQLIEMSNVDEIIHIKKSFKSKLLKYVHLVKNLKKYEYEYIFLGEIGKFHKIVISNVIKNKVFLLDDGTVTLKFYEDVIKTNKYNKYKFKEMRFLFFGLKIKVKDKINLFTYFDLEPVHGIEVIKNRLTFFRKSCLKDSKKGDNLIYFIGQPLDDINLIDVDTYKTILEKLTIKYNKKIIYIPHRYESKNLKNAILSINNTLLKIENLNMPIEMFFIEEKIYPSHIISCFSTALTTLALLYDDVKVNNIEIPEDSSNTMFFDDALRNYYKEIDSNKIITFENLGIRK